MLIGGDDISNDVITLGTCFSVLVYIRARLRLALIGGNLTAQSTGSHRELEVEFKFQRRSCKLFFLFPPRRQSTPESLLAGYKTVTSATNTRVFATLGTRRELELKFVAQLFLGSWTRLSAIG